MALHSYWFKSMHVMWDKFPITTFLYNDHFLLGQSGRYRESELYIETNTNFLLFSNYFKNKNKMNYKYNITNIDC